MATKAALKSRLTRLEEAENEAVHGTAPAPKAADSAASAPAGDKVKKAGIMSRLLRAFGK